MVLPDGIIFFQSPSPAVAAFKISPKSLDLRILFLKDLSIFCLKASTDWMRPTHIMEGNLLYLKSTDLKVNHIKKPTTHKNRQNNV